MHKKYKIPKKEIDQHMREEKAKLSHYKVGSKRYDEVLDRISLLKEIKRRKMVK